MTTPTTMPTEAPAAAAPSLGATLYEGTPAPAATPAAEPAAAPAETPAPAPAAAEPAPTPAAEAPKDGEPAPAPAARTAADYTIDFPPEFQANEPLVGKFRELAAEANLDPAVAQKVAGLYVEAAQATAQQLQSAWNETTTAWHNEVMALPEFAQDRREQTTTLIGRVLDEFSTPEDRALVDKQGLGNFPPFVRLVLSLSNALMEGEPTPQGTPTKNPAGKAPGKATLGQLLYDNQ